ncbi:MAG: adenylyltransferase/cytidyltransferase family protein, partial [Alphaproteobacteria bacterium]
MINHRIGVYPGSFDPITTGHIDIITRSQRLVDKLIVGVAINTGKSPLFSYDERMEM